MNPAKMNGLDLLNAMIDGEFPEPGMGKTMNAHLIEAKLGYAKFSAMAGKEHLNPMGGVHGGFACTILDSVTGCAVHSMMEAGDQYGTIDINVKMMRPIPVGKILYAESHVINMSKTLGVSEAKLVDEEGKLYAYGSCTCKVTRAAQ